MNNNKLHQTKTKTCIIYCRTATSSQTFYDSSIASQEKSCLQYAKKLNYQVLDTFIDAGHSGMNIKRPGLIKMLAKCKTLKPNYLIITDTARLTRNFADYLYFKKILILSGIQIVCSNQRCVESSSIEEALVTSFSEFYSKELSWRIKRGMQQRKEILKNTANSKIK